jgi:hypothetical protein
VPADAVLEGIGSCLARNRGGDVAVAVGGGAGGDLVIWGRPDVERIGTGKLLGQPRLFASAARPLNQ